MKHQLLMALIFGATIVVNAEPIQFSLSANISTTHVVDWQKVSKFRKSADCYPLGKGNDVTPLGRETIVTTLDQQGLGVNTMATSSRSYPFGMGSQSLGLISKGELSAEFFVNDATNWSSYQNYGDSECVIREYHWKISSHKVTGTANVSFKMPVNNWLVRIQIVDFAGGGVDTAAKLVGDLHSVTIKREETIVWGTPGQIIRPNLIGYKRLIIFSSRN